jgi:hypothetical protein
MINSLKAIGEEIVKRWRVYESILSAYRSAAGCINLVAVVVGLLRRRPVIRAKRVRRFVPR